MICLVDLRNGNKPSIRASARCISTSWASSSTSSRQGRTASPGASATWPPSRRPPGTTTGQICSWAPEKLLQIDDDARWLTLSTRRRRVEPERAPQLPQRRRQGHRLVDPGTPSMPSAPSKLVTGGGRVALLPSEQKAERLSCWVEQWRRRYDSVLFFF